MAFEELDDTGDARAPHTDRRLFKAPATGFSLNGTWQMPAAAVALNSAVLALVLVLPTDRAFGEQGLLEVAQVVMLLGIAALFAHALTWRATRLMPLLLSLMMLTIAFAMREGDLRVWDIPAWAKTLGSGSVRNPLTAGFIIVAIVLHIPAQARQTLWS